MKDTIRPARTDTFEHTISGLLTKRAEMFHEAERIRDRLAEIKNDVAALDRVLGTLGYKGDLDAAMPRQKREVIFGRGELTRACIDELRDAPAGLMSRTIAEAILSVSGQDARDRNLMTEHTKRVSKALRALKEEGRVTAAKDERGNMTWRLAGR